MQNQSIRPSRALVLFRPAIRTLQRVWSKLNDLYLGIETDDEARRADVDPQRGWPFGSQFGKQRHQDRGSYQAADYRNLRRMVRWLRPGPSDVFCDIGCGKGRALCVLARHALRRVIGVEISEALCETARRNADRLRARRTPIEIRCEDASVTDLSDVTIYYLYNPFGPDTMRDVLQNIHTSLQINPRKITFVYYNPRHLEVLRALDWLHLTHEFKTLTRRRVTFWTIKRKTGQG
jgi:SAM-dependent methyltransferase